MPVFVIVTSYHTFADVNEEKVDLSSDVMLVPV